MGSGAVESLLSRETARAHPLRQEWRHHQSLSRLRACCDIGRRVSPWPLRAVKAKEISWQRAVRPMAAAVSRLEYASLSCLKSAERQVRFKELLDDWRQNASGARTASEYVVRLPVDDAARLQALAELFPGRTTEQLITDLLGAALHEVAAAMPYVAGKKVISTDDQGDPVFEDTGMTPRFAQLTRTYKKKLEGELKK